MGILSIFSSKNQVKAKEIQDGRKNNGREFSDEDREKAANVRALKQLEREHIEMLQDELAHLKEMQTKRHLEENIEQLKDQLYGNEEEEEEEEPQSSPIESALMALAMSYLKPKDGSAGIADPAAGFGSQSRPAAPLIELTEEEIQTVMDQYRDIAIKYQKLPDSVIYKYIKQQFPQLSENSITLAIGCIKKLEVKA